MGVETKVESDFRSSWLSFEMKSTPESFRLLKVNISASAEVGPWSTVAVKIVGFKRVPSFVRLSLIILTVYWLLEARAADASSKIDWGTLIFSAKPKLSLSRP